MTNQALPQKSRQMLEYHLEQCQNLGLILDKFAPWQEVQRNWDLAMRSTIRQRGQNEIKTLTGGEAKGLWLSTTRQSLRGEDKSLFEDDNWHTDVELMQDHRNRWLNMVQKSEGMAFTMTTAERLVAGLGASHVLETALTLERNTGLPYLPGSTVKGLARAWGLIEVAAQLGVKLEDTIKIEEKEISKLNIVADILMSNPTDYDPENPKKKSFIQAISELYPVSEDTKLFMQWFRFIFGWQGETGAVCFVDAIYSGEGAPKYASDVMTPHYVNYYTENGGKPPAEDDNPNPVSFLTVDKGNTFAFGLIPRQSAFAPEDTENRKNTLEIARDWLVNSLTQLGAGSKTAAGYGFFRKKSFRML